MGLFNGFKSILRAASRPVYKVGKFLEDKIPGGEVIVPAALTAVNPALGATYQGTKTLQEKNSLGKALVTAGTSYAGSKIGSSIGSSIGPTDTLAKTLGDQAGGQFAGSVAPLGSSFGNYLGSTSLGSAIGGAVGSSAGAQAGAALSDSGDISSGSGASKLPSAPRPHALSALDPASLGDAYSGLDPLQRRTKIASEGVYGQGADAAENDYLRNDTNNRLLQEGSNYDLTPIEEQYFQKQGYGFEPGNSQSLLQAFARRYA